MKYYGETRNFPKFFRRPVGMGVGGRDGSIRLVSVPDPGVPHIRRDSNLGKPVLSIT